jgi:16S rRNA processing protein RimM
VTSDRRYVALAEVARPHGIKGEIKLKVYNEDSDLLLGRPPVRLRMPDGAEREVVLRTVRENNKALLVTLEGVTDRDQADALRGALILCAREQFPPLEEGEFYACDLEGAAAVLEGSSEPIGRVSEVKSFPSCDVLVIAREGAPALEVPLVESYVASIDVAGKLVTLHTIEDLG